MIIIVARWGSSGLPSSSLCSCKVKHCSCAITALSQHTINCAAAMDTGTLQDNAENSTDDISTEVNVEEQIEKKRLDAYRKWQAFGQMFLRLHSKVETRSKCGELLEELRPSHNKVHVVVRVCPLGL